MSHSSRRSALRGSTACSPPTAASGTTWWCTSSSTSGVSCATPTASCGRVVAATASGVRARAPSSRPRRRAASSSPSPAQLSSPGTSRHTRLALSPTPSAMRWSAPKGRWMTPDVVDVRMHGHAQITSAYVVRGSRATALVDTGPAASLEATQRALLALGVEWLDWIVLTHVHLDHAGACGALAASHADAQVAVHPRGARHVADPSRLWRGVSAVYGDRTEALWGRPRPVPAARVHAFEDGGALDLGDRVLRAVATPGHARHHHAWIDETSGDAFVGDAVGLQVGSHEQWRATTPPADFDLQLALESIERIRAVAPTRVWLGHFGAARGAVGEVLDAGAEVLREWVGAIRALLESGLESPELEWAVRAWLARRERRAPAAAAALLDSTSDPAIDLAGVRGWLSTAAEGTPR